jgi:hypothetical protein
MCMFDREEAMNSIKLVQRIGVALALLIALSAASVATAATGGQYDRNNRWNRARMARYAYTLGYNRGFEDAAQGSYHSYRQLQRWREGTEGFEDPMGTRSVFRDNFRRGFARGFMDARANRTRRYNQSDADRIREEFREGRPNR